MTRLSKRNRDFIVNGKPYVVKKFQKLQETFPHWSVKTIKRIVASLRSNGYIEVEHFCSGINKTNWYFVTEKAREEFPHSPMWQESSKGQNDTTKGQNDPLEGSNSTYREGQNDPLEGSKEKNLQYNEIKNKDKKENKYVRARAQEVFSNPSSELIEAWDGYVEMRCLMHEPFTSYAVRQIVSRLERLSFGDQSKMVKILNQSVANGWKGVFELPEDKKRTGQPQSVNSSNEMYQEGLEIMKRSGMI